MDLKEEIKKLTEDTLVPGQFVVDVILSGGKAPAKVLVLVDGDEGITIDDCAEISRRLSKGLDDAAMLQQNYLLEVSTPGADQPLKLKRQYRKHLGRKLKVKLSDQIVEGKLSDIGDEKITLLIESGNGKNKESKPLDILFSEVEKAFVVISFK